MANETFDFASVDVWISGEHRHFFLLLGPVRAYDSLHAYSAPCRSLLGGVSICFTGGMGVASLLEEEAGWPLGFRVMNDLTPIKPVPVK